MRIPQAPQFPKLYDEQRRLLSLIGMQGCPVLPNNVNMKSACRELCKLGLLDCVSVVLSDGEGHQTFDTMYTLNSRGRLAMRGA